MKQDIRGLFNHDTFPKKKLPDAHREEFLKKIKGLQTEHTNKTNRQTFFKIAASVAVLISITFLVKNQFSKPVQDSNTNIVSPIKNQQPNRKEKQNIIVYQSIKKNQVVLSKSVVPKPTLNLKLPIKATVIKHPLKIVEIDSLQNRLAQNQKTQSIKVNSNALLYSVTHSSSEVLAYYKEHNLLRASVLASLEQDLKTQELLHVDAETLLEDIERGLGKDAFKDKLFKAIKLKISELSTAIATN